MQLAALERTWQRVQADRLLEAGVTLIDPDRIDIRGELVCGQDVEIDVGCVFEGRVVLGNGVRVGAYSVIRNTTVEDDVEILPFCHFEGAAVGRDSCIGPYSRLRPGAGTITCNYDGVNKFRTVIGDDAFIGSDTQLIAPVEVGAGATIGAGTTLTRNAPAGKLTLSRARQMTIEGWTRPVKKQ